MTPNFADRDGWIWLDGELVPWREARVHVLTHTPALRAWRVRGRARLRNVPRPAVLPAWGSHRPPVRFRPYPANRHALGKDDLLAAQREVFAANGLSEGYLRPVVYLGTETMGLRGEELSVHVAIACWPWPDYMGAESRERGMAVRTSSYTRHHVNVTMCKAKANGNYINSILALREAEASGCDEALLLDNEGYATEGSGENVFLVKDAVLHTPELTSCLPGITRDTIITFARELGWEVVERRITRDEFYIADEAFFTGTAAEVLPIRTLDGRVIGNGVRGR